MPLSRRAFSSLLAAAPAALAAPSAKPNFLVLLADDLGSSDIDGFHVCDNNVLRERLLELSDYFHVRVTPAERLELELERVERRGGEVPERDRDDDDLPLLRGFGIYGE